jgi:hypothetical protein
MAFIAFKILVHGTTTMVAERSMTIVRNMESGVLGPMTAATTCIADPTSVVECHMNEGETYTAKGKLYCDFPK